MQFLKKYPVEIIFSAGFIVLMAILNMQFLEGSNVNYEYSGHDEYLTVREVYSILNPASFKHFFMAVISGDVLYYGRMMFYTDAFFAFLPYKIWGISGMVYAIRMTHVLLLALGITLLSATFLRKNLGKFVFLSAAFMMYFTVYFVIIPKPEPLQLVLIAFFLRAGMQRNWAFGKHFLLLGMAYGVKFNILTILPLFFLLPFLAGKSRIKELIFSGLYFVSGFLIAVPCLVLSPFKPLFLKSYLASTFGNTAHYDDTAVSISAWVKEGWFDMYAGGIIFGSIIVILVVWMMISSLKTYFADKKIDRSFVVLLCGLGILLPVMLFTKRLWSHYLWTGNLLLLAGLAGYIQNEVFSKKKQIIFTVGMIILLVGFLKTSFQKNQGIFSLEKNKLQEIRDGKSAYDYMKSKRSSYLAVQEISVFFPFKEMVETDRYHPFATSYPYPLPETRYVWPSFITPAILKEKQADFLLVYRDFENSNPDISMKSRSDKMMMVSDSLLRIEMGKTILRDTVFGKLKVYKIIHDGK